MTKTALSLEQPRLQAIEQYELVGMPRDPALDDIARLAAQICDAPVSAVGVIERDVISFVGRHGFDLEKAPRESLPCETAASAEGVYEIPDTRRDPAYELAGIPLDGRCYRFFAGSPIQTPRRVAVGCLFVLDSAARKLAPAQIDSLDTLSQMVTTRLELMMRVRETQQASRARQRVEAALTGEKNFVAAVLDTVGALVVVFDPAGKIVRFNRACEMISGCQSIELVGKFAWERLIPEEEIASYIEGFEKIRDGEFPTAFENYWLASDGTRRRISWSATALVDPQGQVAFVIATGIDVTVQRVAENTIRESESRYRQIVEGSLGVVCTHDLEGRILSINKHGAQSFGRTVGDVVGHPVTEFASAVDQDLATYFAELCSTGEAQGLLHLRHIDGEERVLAYRNRLIEPSDGPAYVLAFAVDITEQIRAEEKLRVLIRQSNSVLESVGDGIYGIDLEGRATVVNPAAAQMLGFRVDELLGRNMHELIHHTRLNGAPYPESECPIRGSLDHLTSIRVAHDVFWRKDGSSFSVEYVARPQIESGEDGSTDSSEGRRGRAVGVVVAFTDISERNAMERMKDEFISTVSHELRTPLTSLRAALGLIAGGALETRPEKLQQMMEIAIGNTDRLAGLVNDIVDLERMSSGKAELHFRVCSVQTLFERATAPLQPAAARKNIQFLFKPNDTILWADTDRIVKTLTNLVSNAIRFTPQSSAHPGEIRLSATNLSPDEVLIRVEDRGRGIPTDKLQMIFERFNQVDASDSRTTGGTGLGLAICRSIVTQHGGHIWATSTLGEGSTFHFTLPRKPRSHLQ